MCGPEESAQDNIIVSGRIVNFSSFSNEDIAKVLPEFREVITPREEMRLGEQISPEEVYDKIFSRGHFFRTVILPDKFLSMKENLVSFFGGNNEVIFISPLGEITRPGKSQKVMIPGVCYGRYGKPTDSQW
jgi:hypothetical protein